MAKTNKTMIKNIIIILLSLYGIVVSCELFTMSNRASLLLKECKAAANLLDVVANEEPSFFYDVLVETDEFLYYQNCYPIYYDE